MLNIAVASGKGGTGKTLIATNLFYTLLNKGLSIKLVDCDAEEPNDKLFFDYQLSESIDVMQKTPVIDAEKCTFCGVCKEYCNYNAIFYLPFSKMIYVMDNLCHDCGACLYGCKYSAITEKDTVLGHINLYCKNGRNTLIESRTKVGVYSSVPAVKLAISQVSQSENVIFDAPPGISCPFIHTVAHADFVVLVAESTPFGLSDLKQTVETLKTLDKQYGVVVNKSGLGDLDIYEYLKHENIPILMELPFDEQIAYLYSNGKLIVEADRKWEVKFLSLYENILKNYGNSSY